MRVGNAAGAQLQLDTYGELMQTGWLYAGAAGRLDADLARRLAELADFVCTAWRRPDSGIWEVRSAPLHFTHSKMMCWIALDRAVDLGDRGLIPDRGSSRWRAARAQVATSSRPAATPPTAAATPAPPTARNWTPPSCSASSTATRAQAIPACTPRSTPSDGNCGAARTSTGTPARTDWQAPEGAFLACSFWLAECLARTGRLDEAAALMDELTGLANDVGLYSEEIDPDTGAFLGNLPQGLSHLALISAACAIASATEEAAG